MILPTKHLPHGRALLTVGSQVLKHLDRPKTVSALWEEVLKEYSDNKNAKPTIPFDWFVLALDMLYLIGAIDSQDGLIYGRVVG